MKLAFNIKRCGLFLGLLGSIAAAMAQNTARLRNGDLLFCCANMKTASSFSRSIVASTKGRGSNDINHVAIVCIERGATFIIEATGDKGVWMCPIDTFISRAPKADDGTPLLLHGRIKGNVDISTSIANAKSRIGLKYDRLFSNTDDEFYCSELVQKSFVDDVVPRCQRHNPALLDRILCKKELGSARGKGRQQSGSTIQPQKSKDIGKNSEDNSQWRELKIEN